MGPSGPAGLRQRGKAAPAAVGGGGSAESERQLRGKPRGEAPAGSDSTDATSEGDILEDDELDDDPLAAEESGARSATDMDDAEWEEMFACPLTVRFSQEKIHPFFYRRGPIVNVVPKIRPVLRGSGVPHDPGSVLELVPPFNPIHCLRKDDELWSLDNRRLYALQLAAMEHWPHRCRIRVLCRDRLPRHKLKMNWRKLSTTSEGRSVDVQARYKQFDKWNWFKRAAELEAAIFSQRIGFLLSVFQFAPVVGGLLFRTGLTGFTSRVPLIVGFVLTLSLDLLRQKVPAIERRICELHVQAVLNGEVRPSHPCWRRFRRLRPSARDPEDEEEEEPQPMSAPQLAATMATALLLLLPYVVGIAHSRLRSSLLSCWAGVACMLLIQLVGALRSDSANSAEKLSPKN